MPTSKSATPGQLRSRAETLLRDQTATPERRSGIPAENLKAVVHELEVHQIELELQNENLQRTEVELRAAHRRFTSLFDHAPVGYFVIDAKGMVESVNRTACAMLGRPASALLGRPFHLLIDPADRDIFYKVDQALRGGADRQVAEARLLIQDGESLPVRLDCASGTGGEDDPSQIWCAAIDISKQWQHERALRASERKFRAIAQFSTDWESWFGGD